MDLYSIVLFVHIVGALLLFVLLTVEGVGLRAGFPSAAVNRVLGPISALAILTTPDLREIASDGTISSEVRVQARLLLAHRRGAAAE